MRKSAFTLIELLVYMAIMGFIIVVAGKVFSDSTGMRVRTQSMTKATEVVNATVALLREDLGRMGAKEWKVADQSEFRVDENVYRNLSAIGGDTSSFVLTRSASGEKLDAISFNTMDFSSNGELLAVREISYSVNANKELERRCRTLGNGTESGECPSGSQSSQWPDEPKTIMAANVEKFSLNPSIPGIRPANGSLSSSIDAANALPTLFPLPANNSASFAFVPSDNILSGNNTNWITLSGFKGNEQNPLNPTPPNFDMVFLAEPNSGSCKDFSFVSGETYAIQFDLHYPASDDDFCRMCIFQPGEDHIAIGLRKHSDLDETFEGVPDFTVFPPQTPTDIGNVPTLRYQEFSIPVNKDSDGNPVISTLNACISVTFAFYSPWVKNGRLTFSNFKVFRKTNEIYHFAADPDNYLYNPETHGTNKADVKAFELELSINIRGETTSSKSIVPVPNNGVFVEGSP